MVKLAAEKKAAAAARPRPTRRRRRRPRPRRRPPRSGRQRRPPRRRSGPRPPPRRRRPRKRPTRRKAAKAKRPTPRPRPRRKPSNSAGGGTWAAVEAYYLGLVNCARTGGVISKSGKCSGGGSRNVRPLRLDAGISSKVSRPYARKLATSGACSHFSGNSPSSRLRRRRVLEPPLGREPELPARACRHRRRRSTRFATSRTRRPGMAATGGTCATRNTTGSGSGSGRRTGA